MRKYGGMGLGLSIVRHLTEAHGGSVAASSEGLGRGARFVVRLPLAPTPLSNVEPERASVSPALSLDGLSVLLVDDEASGRDALAHMLGAIGAQVAQAGSAAEALELLERRRFDAMVADVAMPGADGYELIRNVRARNDDAVRSLYAIALTGFTSLGERDEALASGYDAHFGKPPSLSEIATRIASGVRARDAMRSNNRDTE